MNVLTRKLWRTIGSTRGQFLAVAGVVTVGITVYIAMSTAYYNLNRSRAAFYDENDFADYYFHVVRAPGQIIRQVEAVPGVEKVKSPADGMVLDLPVEAGIPLKRQPAG